MFGIMFGSLFNFVLLCIAVVSLQPNKTNAAGNTILEFFNPQEPKIINGTVASLDATRHQVSIRKRKNDGFFFGTGHVCGGSLISENVVLTAAHCFVNYEISEPSGTYYSDDSFIAVMGNLDRFEYDNNTLVFDFKKIVKHSELFPLLSFKDDIALIFLDGKVPAKHSTVRPIVLKDGPLSHNATCQVTGWGLNEDGYSPDVLMAVDLPIIEIDDCREKTAYGGAVYDSMICAGYLEGEKDACKGDSGGALVCGGLQAGIVSWGNGCANAFNPGVYTNVTYYKDWILEEVAKNNGTLPKFAGPRDEGNGDGETDGATGISCSLILTTCIVMFNIFSFVLKPLFHYQH